MHPRILLVEDVPSTRKAYRRLLELHGLEIYEAKTLKEADHALRRMAFHVVCIDLGLEESDPSNLEGVKVLQSLEAYHEGTRAIIVSQKGGDRAHDIAIEAYERFRLSKWLRKGQFSPEEFVSAVEGEARSVKLPIFKTSTSTLEALTNSLEDDLWIDRALEVIRPKGGLVGLREIVEALSKDLNPIRPHRKPDLCAKIDYDKRSTRFQLWSRGVGCALVIEIYAGEGPADDKSAIRSISVQGLTGCTVKNESDTPDNYL